jgi:hypothetical protein
VNSSIDVSMMPTTATVMSASTVADRYSVNMSWRMKSDAYSEQEVNRIVAMPHQQSRVGMHSD